MYKREKGKVTIWTVDKVMSTKCTFIIRIDHVQERERERVIEVRLLHTSGHLRKLMSPPAMYIHS